MFERFTDRARRVVVMAQEEARLLNHNYIGTEHILLGIVSLGEGTGAKALQSLGIRLEAVRQQVEEIVGVGKRSQSGHIPFTPRAKKALEMSLRESLQLGQDYIGTEHILLGLLREGDGVAAQVLVRMGADLNRVRDQVIQLLAEHEGQEPRTVRARPVSPSAAAFARQQEILRTLADITARLSAVEEHLGIRRRPEGGQAGQGGAPGPAAPGPGEPESGKAESGKAESGKAESGKAESGKAGSGKTHPDEEPGDIESGAAGTGEDQPGQGEEPAPG
jgi:hypothetical protein